MIIVVEENGNVNRGTLIGNKLQFDKPESTSFKICDIMTDIEEELLCRNGWLHLDGVFQNDCWVLKEGKLSLRNWFTIHASTEFILKMKEKYT